MHENEDWFHRSWRNGSAYGQQSADCRYEVHAFDVVEAAVKEMEGKGAIGHPSAGEMAGHVDVIICSLPNAKIVEGTMCGKNGVFENCKEKGTIIIDMSSVAPNTTKGMAKKAAEKGIHYIDAPVSGGVSGAAAGTLTIMVGADDETFDKVKPIFDVLGKNIYHVGEAGAATPSRWSTTCCWAVIWPLWPRP